MTVKDEATKTVKRQDRRPAARTAASSGHLDHHATVEHLNRMLAQEHACAIRYATHAAVVSGPYSETVAARLKEISEDELLHAEMLRARILALGGQPTLDVSRDDLRHAEGLDEILTMNIAEERQAIRDYTEILERTPQSNVILYQTVQEILRDEQEHLEELEGLRRPRDVR